MEIFYVDGNTGVGGGGGGEAIFYRVATFEGGGGEEGEGEVKRGRINLVSSESHFRVNGVSWVRVCVNKVINFHG